MATDGQIDQLGNLEPSIELDWDLCIICQKPNSEKLRFPFNSNKNNYESAYANCAKNFMVLKNLDLLPDIVCAKLLCVNDTEQLSNIFKIKKGGWHKNCHVNFSDYKVNRIVNKKRKIDDVSEVCDEVPLVSFDAAKKRLREKCEKVTETKKICIFCGVTTGKLHRAMTHEIHKHVTEKAIICNDFTLLGKLSEGDMTAKDRYYHKECLTKLNNEARKIVNSNEYKVNDYNSSLRGIAFGELVEFLKDLRVSSKNTPPIITLAKLRKLYLNRLSELGLENEDVRNATLKDRLKNALNDLSMQVEGNQTYVTFAETVASAVKSACDYYDDEGVILAKAAKILRKRILKTNEQDHCLTSFIDSVMYGSRINSITPETVNNDVNVRQAVNTVVQTITFNMLKYSPQIEKSTVRHNKNQETSLQIYTSFKLHAETRSKELIQNFHKLGLCISYDRMLSLSTETANRTCQLFEKEGVVCPPELKKGIFTTAAIDNIDHNLTSNTAKTSLHGTAITIMQHPTTENSGEKRILPKITDVSAIKVHPLPEFYSVVPSTTVGAKIYNIPQKNIDVENSSLIYENNLNEEFLWLESVNKCIHDKNNQSSPILNLKWSSFHSTKLRQINRPNTIVSLLPLFNEKVASYNMLLHGMNIIKATTHNLNPNQTIVIVGDQPVYAYLKYIQWKLNETHGEDTFIIMLGGLHIEMAMLKCIGKWLELSGWTHMLTNAGVTTDGTADSFVKVTHVKRTRTAHEITAAALHILLMEAYNKYCSGNNNALNMSDWQKTMCTTSKQFKYWKITLDMELNTLLFIRSLREANFDLYIESLIQFAPWFFALDQQNYSRWLPVHIVDMLELHKTHPDVHSEFMRGAFVARLTSNVFSSVALDQAHEQVNAKIKGCSGIIGLTTNNSARDRWTIAGPEIAKLIESFEKNVNMSNNSADEKLAGTPHHESGATYQINFHKDVKNLLESFRTIGSPFLDNTCDLYSLDTNIIINPKHAEEMLNAREVGKKCYNNFVLQRLIKKELPFHIAVKQNKIPLFSSSKVKCKDVSNNIISDMKQFASIFSRMYFASQRRDGSESEFFKHENCPLPPSITNKGKMRQTNKAALLPCLEQLATSEATARPTTDVIIVDGPAIAHMLEPKYYKIMEQYILNSWVTYVEAELKFTSRLDLVWDVYLPHSLKNLTREKRGTGIRCKVLPSTPIPSCWSTFLRVNENKQEFFYLLADMLISTTKVLAGKELWCTKGEDVLCTNTAANTSDISPCTHEEADTRVILHASHATAQGHKKITIRTYDTDVVVLCVAHYNDINSNELWVHFGPHSSEKFIPVHEIANALGPQRCSALPIFHAITGCDTTSSFAGYGKNLAWLAWKSYENVTKAFIDLACSPVHISDETMSCIERFIILLYSNRNNTHVNIDEFRRKLFISRKMNFMQNIPPTHDALVLHVKRAVYQGGYVWGQCLEKDPQLPNPSGWGWKQGSEGSGYQPHWTTLPMAQDCCLELIKCGCKKGCKQNRCTCFKESLPCTELCACDGCDAINNRK